MQSGDYFGEVKFTGGHEQTIVAVANGDIDAGVTWADGSGQLGRWLSTPARFAQVPLTRVSST
ncbi:MAG: hypothetical protein EpisKO_09430 [Epibacterium sp.]